VIFGSADKPVCAADGVWSQRALGNVDSLSGTCAPRQTRARCKAKTAAVFEQMWRVDWLRTATVCNRQTTGCRNETVEWPIPLTFPSLSLSGQPADRPRQGQRCMKLLSDVLTLVWDCLDWMALPRCCPPRATRRGSTHSLGCILKSH